MLFLLIRISFVFLDQTLTDASDGSGNEDSGGGKVFWAGSLRIP